MKQRRAGFACVVICTALPGCNALVSESTADVAAIASTALVARYADSAAVATGIGLAVRSIAHAGLELAQREVHSVEQADIATAAGRLDVGEIGAWQSSLPTPTEPLQGRVAVSREIHLDTFHCRDIVFSIDDADEIARYFTSTICRTEERWHWAVAEPATERWGALQCLARGFAGSSCRRSPVALLPRIWSPLAAGLVLAR